MGHAESPSDSLYRITLRSSVPPSGYQSRLETRGPLAHLVLRLGLSHRWAALGQAQVEAVHRLRQAIAPAAVRQQLPLATPERVLLPHQPLLAGALAAQAGALVIAPVLRPSFLVLGCANGQLSIDS